MRAAPLKWLLIVVLVPALSYAAVKGLMYYNAKRTVDDAVMAMMPHATVTYSGLTTEITGAVSVDDIAVLPLGLDESSTVRVDRVRMASDDLLFFLRNDRWQPGESAPPKNLGFEVSGVHLPIETAVLASPELVGQAATDGCKKGLQVDAAMLRGMGFEQLNLDASGYYRIDEANKTLELSMDMDVHDVQSMRVAATLTDVDVEGLAQGAAPALNLGRLEVGMAVSPEFGRRALKHCARGSEDDIAVWSERLAQQALQEFEQGGVQLGSGLVGAVKRFYRDWGEFEITAKPAQPVGLLSMMFVPPDRLAETLNLSMRLNGDLITDTRFNWVGPQAGGLAALFGEQQGASEPAAPRRIIVRREFERVPAADIGRYLGHEVKIKPRGQPRREGELLRITDGIAEVEESLYGGEFTVYVPVRDIESLDVLIQRRIGDAQ